MNVDVVTGHTTAQSVNARLAADILSGRLAPGTKLKLLDLCNVYGTGMSPLREALAGLSGRGLVVQAGQRGFRVATASVEDLADVVATRLRIEVMALQLSVKNGDTTWEADVLHAFHMMNRSPRTPQVLIDERWEALHKAYHASLVSACGSRRLREYCWTLHEQFDRYRRIAVHARGAHSDLEPMDDRLVEAALKRDVDAASNLLSRHIEASGTAVAVMLANVPLRPEE